MTPEDKVSENRRLLIKFFAMSPLLAFSDFSHGRFLSDEQDPLITKASQALNVFDFKRVAKEKLSTAHYGYLETGVLDNWTLLENEKAFQRIKLNMRRLIGAIDVDISTSLFGESWSSPIMLCPCGSQKAFHSEGEIATARAAKSQNTMQVLSTMSTSSIEDVVTAKGSPVWFQLYPSLVWEDTAKMVMRAKASGSKALVLTVDSDYTDKREAYSKAASLDKTNCKTCHGKRTLTNFLKTKPMIKDLDNQFQLDKNLTWDYIKRLQDLVDMKIILKGIVSKEDAQIALEHGVDGIIVSNHGGRVSESGIAAIDSLSEVAKVVNGSIPVMMDGGVRRGKDVFKAIAKGASMVGIGRPYLWGLSAFGQEGVEMVLKLLTAELKLAMQQTGVKTISEINGSQLL